MTSPAEQVERLPRGPHGLSRDEVAKVQYDRIIRAMIEIVAEESYATCSVAKVVARARVSRESFYQHFANKQECFLAGYDATAAAFIAEIQRVQAELPPDTDPFARVDAAVGTYIEQMAADPPAAQTYLIQVFAAGPESLARLLVVRQAFVDAALQLLGRTDDEARFLIQAYMAAAAGLATQLACAGRTADAGELLEPLRRLARLMLQSSTPG